MTKWPKPILFLLLVFPLYYSCNSNSDSPPSQIEGYVPIYTTNVAAVKVISATGPRSIVNGGKLYTTGNLLFQVELDSGIHIINYADPRNPRKLAFIRSFLCKEVTEKGGFLYTNNMADLVVIDIRNLNDIKLVARTENVFPDLQYQTPPKNSQSQAYTWFECPDQSKGIVIGWKEQTLTNPRCYK